MGRKEKVCEKGIKKRFSRRKVKWQLKGLNGAHLYAYYGYADAWNQVVK